MENNWKCTAQWGPSQSVLLTNVIIQSEDDMDAVWDKRKLHTQEYTRIDHVEDLGADERKISIWILDKSL
jgi:hypothetical protein